MESPAAIYRRQLDALGVLVARRRCWSDRLGYAKLAYVPAAMLAAVALRHSAWLAPLLVPAAAGLVAMIAAHERLLRGLRRSQSRLEFYARGLARLEDRWAGAGAGGENFLDPAHPYARDLDLFGPGSLFELLCAARTRAGEATLAAWLLAPALPEIVLSRQAAARELGARLDFRERLFAVSAGMAPGKTPAAGIAPKLSNSTGIAPNSSNSAGIAPGSSDSAGIAPGSSNSAGIAPGSNDSAGIAPNSSNSAGIAPNNAPRVPPASLPEAFADWGASPPLFRRIPALAALLAPLAALWLAAAVFALATWNWLPLLLVSLLNLGLSRLLKPRVEASIAAVESVAADLRPLARVLALIEQEAFEAPALCRLRHDLIAAGAAPAQAVARLRRLVESLESRRNLILQPLSPLVFYAALLALGVENWRRHFGPAVRAWLAAVGELEALASLGGYAWEHPGDVWPEFAAGGPLFEAVALAHPLLPESRAVGNDLRLDAGTRLLVISGPNMAGKSTFLRGVGINAVLAQCGAPARARRLRLSPLAVGASICVLDSLQGGVSRFYAEIRRLKLLADLAAGPRPLLFLLDELLSGTNSHDRYAGARLITRALLARGALGLVTTHDLALAQIPETVAAARNFHFDDRFEAGQLCFDYRLLPGVARSSNALKLMQSVGLEVYEPPPG